MARRVADALLAAGCSPVIAIGGDADDLRALGLDRVDDEFPGEGPLGGVLTALSLGAPAAVLACDLPNIRAATVVELIAALGPHDASMAVSDRPEPLCAVWSRSAAALLRLQFASGERAMHRAIESLDIAWVDVSTHDLRNVNTPDDLRRL
jgi:molybdopterin-guanine dinucleotide biosynthesis protein A